MPPPVGDVRSEAVTLPGPEYPWVSTEPNQRSQLLAWVLSYPGVMPNRLTQQINGKRGGHSTSWRKQLAAQENGRKGGRRPKGPRCPCGSMSAKRAALRCH